MKKDLFDYIVVPTANEYRKENIIDNICCMPKLKIPEDGHFYKHRGYLINDAIVNYNNEIVVAKMFYANMIKYQKYFNQTKDENYDFWSRKNGEQLIKELFSIYDKSFHILNYLFDMKIYPDRDFKKNVRQQLMIKDKKFYNKFNSVFSRLYNDKIKNTIRDDITHNFSNLFFKYIPEYYDGKETGWYTEESLTFIEFKNVIDEICNLLAENRQLIIDKISQMYPKKGTKKYIIIKKETEKRLDQLFNELK